MITYIITFVPKSIVLILLSVIFLTAMAQKAIPPEEKLDWWGDIDGYYNQQAFASLALVDEALKKYHPQLPEPLERKMAMLMLDGVLHEEEAPHRPAVQDFLHRRIKSAAKHIEYTRVTEGAMIWKLYNEGFVVRTATVTLAFDLSRAFYIENFAIPDPLMQRVIDQCDVLFVSHRHRDHADPWVAEQFINQGKPVIAPEEVWNDLPFHSKVTHLTREAHTEQSLPIQNGKHTLKVIVYPGHQGPEIPNNVPLVFTPEGMSFSQTGDQSLDEDFSWIDEVGQRYRVDVLFPNCWTTDIVRMARGFHPNLIITGHENEMNHTVDHREANFLTYTRLRRSNYPYLLMTWGEAYHYHPNQYLSAQ